MAGRCFEGATDTGLANGQAYFYKVAAANAIGTGAQSNKASATPVGSSCTPPQLLGNPGLETGNHRPLDPPLPASYTRARDIHGHERTTAQRILGRLA